MKDHKFYVIRISTIHSSQGWSQTEDEELGYEDSELALSHSADMEHSIAELVSDVISNRGERLDWIEKELDDIYAEEWVIYDEDCLDELSLVDFGVDDVEVEVDISTNTWNMIEDEWHISISD